MTDASGKDLRDTNDRADAIDAGPVTSQEAREIASRFINSHFNNPGEKARISIPADPLRDDDIRLIAYIKQSAAEIERLRSVVEQCKPFLDDAGNVRKVLGTLPITADGVIIGSGGEVWQEDANWESQKRPRFYCRALYSANTSERTPRYSTLAAAEAGEVKEKPSIKS